MPCNDRIEAAARAINPRAFSGAMLRMGCGSGWHYGSHSSQSTCPSCGGGRWTNGTELADRQERAQADARASARAALAAADALPGEEVRAMPSNEGVTGQLEDALRSIVAEVDKLRHPFSDLASVYDAPMTAALLDAGMALQAARAAQDARYEKNEGKRWIG